MKAVPFAARGSPPFASLEAPSARLEPTRHRRLVGGQRGKREPLAQAGATRGHRPCVAPPQDSRRNVALAACLILLRFRFFRTLCGSEDGRGCTLFIFCRAAAWNVCTGLIRRFCRCRRAACARGRVVRPAGSGARPDTAAICAGPLTCPCSVAPWRSPCARVASAATTLPAARPSSRDPGRVAASAPSPRPRRRP